MPMGGSGGGSGGGGGVAPSELEEIAKTTEEIAKKGMSNGAKLAIFGLLAVGGYFAWKYRDMIFNKK
jgi:predicted negative regulator of RcsB-dependent stress response